MSYVNPNEGHMPGMIRSHYLGRLGDVPRLVAPVLGGGFGGVGSYLGAYTPKKFGGNGPGDPVYIEHMNIIDRFLKTPRGADSDITKARSLVAALFAPAAGLIDSVPLVPVGMKNAFKRDPFGLLFDQVQNSRAFMRDLVNRVAQRSGRLTRTFGTTVIRMTARRGDSMYRTLLQFIVLMMTDWYATHEETARMIVGAPVGTKIPLLGGLGGWGLGIPPEPVSTTVEAAALAAPAVTATSAAAEGVTLTEITALIGGITMALGGATALVTAIATPLLLFAGKDENSAAARAKAAFDADEQAKVLSSVPGKTAVGPGAGNSGGGGGAGIQTSSGGGGGMGTVAVIGAAVVGYLILKGR